jgi:hypothetical protein
MLRDGLLSPHSKLLPQNIRSDASMVATDSNRHGSVMSSSKRWVSTCSRNSLSHSPAL